MALICPGPNNVIPSNPAIGAVAQQHIFERFREAFEGGLCPTGGLVIQELDYLGFATSIFSQRLGLLMKSNKAVNDLLLALQEDYRRTLSQFSFRKNDALGICPLGISCNLQLIEVTTYENRASAIIQLDQKMSLLRSIDRQYNLRMQIIPAFWRPEGYARFRKYDASSDEITWICFEPTFRESLPGIILYEVHRQKLEKELAKQIVPADARERMRRAIQAIPPDAKPEEAERRGREFARQNPDLTVWLRGIAQGILLVALGIILAIVAVYATAEAALAAAIVFAIAFVQEAMSGSNKA